MPSPFMVSCSYYIDLEMCVCVCHYTGLMVVSYLLRRVEGGAQRLAQVEVGGRAGGLPEELILRRRRCVRTRHGIARVLGVASGREHDHHSGQRESPSLLDEPPHPRSGGRQRAGDAERVSPAFTVRWLFWSIRLHASTERPDEARR